MAKIVKVPVIMQMEVVECGAAALAMILAYYKKWIPLEQMRIDCGISRDGSTAKSLAIAAKKHGMQVSAYRYSVEMLKGVKVPAILHWNLHHFVVLCGFNKKGAVLNDPAKGRVTVSMEEFDSAFTGVALLMEPGEGFEKSGNRKSIVQFAKKRLTGTLAAFVVVAVTANLLAVVDIAQPLLSKIFLDNILSGNNPEWLRYLLILMGIVVAFAVVVNLINAIYLRKIQGKFDVISNSQFMWHVLRLPMNFFSQRHAGDLAQRQSLNASITNTLLGELAPVGMNLILLVLYLTIMIKYSVTLTLVGIFTVVINLCIARYISVKSMNINRVIMREEGRVISTTISGIEMIETIKASGSENGFFKKWSGYVAKQSYESGKRMKMNIYMSSVSAFLSETANVIVLLLGAALIIKGHFTAGMLLAFQGFISSFISPALQLINVSSAIEQMKASMERIDDIMEYKTDVDYEQDSFAPLEENARKLSGKIELTNVTFGYSTMRPALISDFSIDINPGSKVAFVGASGCGKSTITSLISGLYKPWSGEILFDKKPMSEFDRMIFTSSVAVVNQDITLFEDTVANNVRMWDESIEDFEIIMAAKDAQIHDEIMHRDGYQTSLTEGGENFSGGQRQRLEIARVLAQDPTIIILDEATSALDAKTEYEVTKAIKDRGITCIIVAHRLSTIRDCDEIVVMDKGRVVERGTHEELVALGGKYTELITME